MAAVVAAALALGVTTATRAAPPRLPFLGAKKQPNPFEPDTSQAARQSAVRSIPFERLDAHAQAKAREVLSQVSVFRRMPVQVIDCDPNLYLFLIQHPDVVVNIWEVLKITRLRLTEVGPGRFEVIEPAGTAGNIEYLYSNHDTQVIYGEGTYEGPLFARPVQGKVLIVVKTGYVRETNGRNYITTRMDCFLSVDHTVAALVTRTIHGLMGNVADTNFSQTMSFLGSLSRTAEVKHHSVQRLAGRLVNVQPELRQRLAELAGQIGRESYAVAGEARPGLPEVAVRPTLQTAE